MRKFSYMFVIQSQKMVGDGTFYITSDGKNTKFSEAKFEHTIKLLNHCGNQGWEVVGVSYIENKPIGDTIWTLRKGLTE